MGEVFNPRDWKANTSGGLVCAFIFCRNRPTNQCPKCSNYYCSEHAQAHEHRFGSNSIQKEKDDLHKMR